MLFQLFSHLRQAAVLAAGCGAHLAPGFFQQPQQEHNQQAGGAHGDKGHLPGADVAHQGQLLSAGGLEILVDGPAYDVGETAAQGDAQAVHCCGAGQFFAGETGR